MQFDEAMVAERASEESSSVCPGTLDRTSGPRRLQGDVGRLERGGWVVGRMGRSNRWSSPD